MSGDLPSNPFPLTRVIWNPQGYGAPDIPGNRAQAYYPGDAYVDVVGNDLYDGHDGKVTGKVSGGAGNDHLIGGAAAEVLSGGDGKDLLTGHGGPEMLRYGDAPDPVAGPGEVVVDIHVASVNAADYKVRRATSIHSSITTAICRMGVNRSSVGSPGSVASKGARLYTSKIKKKWTM